ncbi:hypothetical protein acdb102_30990 [Acidothermaceae bacterium B102]|nr:hypothetical protein acdb102_30990 [Acidothermaceae bacterium B102]
MAALPVRATATVARASDTAQPAGQSASAASDAPINFYRSQYERLTGPANAASIAFTKDLASYGATSAQVDTSAHELAVSLEATNEALLAAKWPANIITDIRAYILASASELDDLYNMSMGSAHLAHDQATASAKRAVLHADLGLSAPPASAFATPVSAVPASQSPNLDQEIAAAEHQGSMHGEAVGRAGFPFSSVLCQWSVTAPFVVLDAYRTACVQAYLLATR